MRIKTMAWFLIFLALLGITLRVHGDTTDAAAAAKSSYCAGVSGMVTCYPSGADMCWCSLMISPRTRGALIQRQIQLGLTRVMIPSEEIVTVLSIGC